MIAPVDQVFVGDSPYTALWVINDSSCASKHTGQIICTAKDNVTAVLSRRALGRRRITSRAYLSLNVLEVYNDT